VGSNPTLPAICVMMLALALLSGLAATFNPCGVGLLPSFVAVLVGAPGSRRWPVAVAEGAAVGAGMTVGLLLLYVPVAIAFGAIAAWLGARLPALGAAVGALVLLWGIGILLRPERLLLHINVPQGRAGGSVAYGVAFGLGSLGCTFPLFISLVAQATAAGSAIGAALVVIAYAIGMGVTVTALGVASRLAGAGLGRFLRGAATALPRLSGAVVALSGALVLAYWLRAGL
jgi:cytochrome c-type biogenesis protein